MMMRRRRPLMRAAMVGGVAYHAGKRREQGREDEAYQDQQIADLQAQQAAHLRRPRLRLRAGCPTTRSTSSSSSAS